MIEAVHIYNSFRIKPKITFTGYAGFHNTTPYAKHTSTFAQSLGIPATNMIVLGQEKDTVEEAIVVTSIVENSAVILVTSALYMPRAVDIFEYAGVSVIPDPIDYRVNNLPFFAQLRLVHLQTSNLALHEHIGRTWLYIRGVL